MEVIKGAMGDAFLTFMWVFCKAALRIVTTKAAAFLGFQRASLAGFFITSVLATVLVFIIRLIGRLLGGASFNPSTAVTFYIAGLRPGCSLSSMAIRIPAQAAGGAVGAKVILQVIPNQYKNMIKGPSLKVDLHTGAVAEGALTFFLNLIILVVVLKGPRNPLMKLYLVGLATGSFAILGSSYTGPAMNPANAFGWAYVYNRHNTWEQFYVYWICPFIGAVLAAWVYRFLFMSPVKQKKV